MKAYEEERERLMREEGKKLARRDHKEGMKNAKRLARHLVKNSHQNRTNVLPPPRATVEYFETNASGTQSPAKNGTLIELMLHAFLWIMGIGLAVSILFALLAR